jgi:ketosteroid isomerase-like protein
MKRFIFYLLLPIFYIACTDQKTIDTVPDKTRSEADDIKIVQETVRREQAAITSANTQGLHEIFSEDAELITPGSPLVRGKDAHKWLDDLSANYIITARPYSDEEFEVNGDLAYHRYTFEMEIIPRKGGDTIVHKGAGIHLLKKKSDSTWVIIKDIWMPLPAAGQSTATKVE